MYDYTKEEERIRNLLLDVLDYNQNDKVDLFEDNEVENEEDSDHNSGTDESADEKLTSMFPTASSQKFSAKENIVKNAEVCLL